MTLIHAVDASDAASMFSDTGKTTPIVNAATVAAMVPVSGSLVAIDCLQSTANKRPLYHSNYSSSGYPGLQFDGSNDELTVVHDAGFVSTSYDFFAVVTMVSITGQKLIAAKLTNSSWNDGLSLVCNAGTLEGGAPSYSRFNQAGVWVAGTRTVIWGRSATSNTLVYIGKPGDVQIFDRPRSGSAASCASTVSYSIGSGSGGGSYFASFVLHELQIRIATESVGAAITRARALENKWGVNTYSSGSSRPSSPFLSQVIG